MFSPVCPLALPGAHGGLRNGGHGSEGRSRPGGVAGAESSALAVASFGNHLAHLAALCQGDE